ncbi:hypothetical protein LJC02_00810 [Breznakia sp. OttesenSCG-928-G09]|nr:hypothetical protein [Breznakia sp. OttesenSCG-928-G09]
MAQKGIIKNTTDNESYISASDWAFMQDSLIGQSGVMDYKERLEVVKINDNTVRIKSGVYFLNGKAIVVDNYEDITIDSGSLGVKRYDYIIAEYVKDGESEGNDFLGFRVLKGNSTSGNPVKPTLTNSDIVEQEELCLIYVDSTLLSVLQMTEKSVKSINQKADAANVYTKADIEAMMPYQKKWDYSVLHSFVYNNRISILNGEMRMIGELLFINFNFKTNVASLSNVSILQIPLSELEGKTLVSSGPITIVGNSNSIFEGINATVGKIEAHVSGATLYLYILGPGATGGYWSANGTLLLKNI